MHAEQRLRSCLVLLLFLAAGDALAFNGEEHKKISNTALLVYRTSHGISDSLLDALLEPADPQRTFGDLTRMVDWYQDPGKFADPEKTRELPACDWKRIEDRKRFGLGKVMHLVAIHRNDTHFQNGAADRYAELHRRAREVVETAPQNALWLEAFALHYLQDFFAPGHMVSPRARNDDVIAASLHDQFNRAGMELRLPAERRPALRQALAKAGIDVKLLPMLDDVLRARGEACIPIFGDGRLPELQFEFLVALSAASIAEVFDPALRPASDDDLALCFTPRSATTPNGEKVSTAARNFRGPVAALSPASAVPPEKTRCSCGDDVYAVADFTGVKALGERWYSPNVWQAGVLAGQGGRRRFDVGRVVLAYEPSRMLRKRTDEGCGERLSTYLTASGSIHYAFTDAPRLRGDGLHLQFGRAWPKFSTFGYVGLGRYRSPRIAVYRYYYGAKVVAGFEVLNFTASIENGQRTTDSDSIDRAWIPMVGADLNLAHGWVRAARNFLFRLVGFD